MKAFEAWCIDNPLLSYLVLASALFASLALAHPGTDSALFAVWVAASIFAVFSLGRLAFHQLWLAAVLRESEQLDGQLAEMTEREDAFWKEIADAAVTEFVDKTGVDPDVARRAVAEKVIELRMDRAREHLSDELDLVEQWANARGALRSLDKKPKKES